MILAFHKSVTIRVRRTAAKATTPWKRSIIGAREIISEGVSVKRTRSLHGGVAGGFKDAMERGVYARLRRFNMEKTSVSEFLTSQ